MFSIKGDKHKEELKEAFAKVKNDIFVLQDEFFSIKNELLEIKELLKAQITNSTNQQISPTHFTTPTDNPTVPSEIRGLIYPNFNSSIGNEGVPTDRQTNQQTDNPTDFTLKKSILEATEMLNSLDNIRKEIRLNFKTITNQEMLVFSTIYELSELRNEGVEYTEIADKLKLSPSSIRDYVQKIISKGIPIIKTKVNNKKILLNISPELKKLATLQTIIKLREL